MTNRLTIKKIAELAGVSTATVSKVLNNNGRYSEETKKKVLEIVKKYQYQPNAVAKSLRTNKSKTIGVIVPDITNEFFAHIVRSIENFCHSHGYSVFIFNSDEKEEREFQYIKELEIKGVDGLIYLPGSDRLIEYQKNTSLPIVCMDRSPKGLDFPVVSSDNYTGGYIATKELIDKGCRNILMIRDYRDLATMSERFAGYLNALEEHGITFKPENIIKTEVGIDKGKQALQHLLKADQFNFDGIFATSDWLALGAILALQEYSIAVPKEVKIVGFDNITLTQYTNPSITTVNQDKNALGIEAAKKLLGIIEFNGEEHNNITTVPVKLIQRESTSK